MNEQTLKRRLMLLAVFVPLVEAALLLNWETFTLIFLQRTGYSYLTFVVLTLVTGVALALIGFYVTQTTRLGTETGAMKLVAYWMITQGCLWWLVQMVRDYPPRYYLTAWEMFTTPNGLMGMALFTGLILLIFMIASLVIPRKDEGWRLRFWSQDGRMRWSWVASWLVWSVVFFALWEGLIGVFIQDSFSVLYRSLLRALSLSAEGASDILFVGSIYTAIDNLSHPVFSVLLSLGWLITWMTLRVRVGSEGVVMKLAGLPFDLARVPWERMRRIDVIRHKKSSPSVVIHYATRWRLPFSLNLSAKRYLNGEKLIETIETESSRREIPHIFRYSPDWVPWTAYAFLALGIGLNLSQSLLSNELWWRYMYDVIPPTQLDVIFAGIPLALLFAGSVLCFGLFLGLLSSFYRGGFRPVLGGAWVVLSIQVPSPLVHWLVWMMIYAIHRAQMWIVIPSPNIPAPSMAEMNFAIGTVALAPAIAGLGYVLGVIAGCWRKPALVPVVQPAPTKKTAPASS